MIRLYVEYIDVIEVSPAALGLKDNAEVSEVVETLQGWSPGTFVMDFVDKGRFEVQVWDTDTGDEGFVTWKDS